MGRAGGGSGREAETQPRAWLPPYPGCHELSHGPTGTDLLMDSSPPRQIWAPKGLGWPPKPPPVHGHSPGQLSLSLRCQRLPPDTWHGQDVTRCTEWDGGRGTFLGVGSTDPCPAAAARCGSWSGRRCSAGPCCRSRLPGSPRGPGEPARPRQRPGGGWQPCRGWTTSGWTDGTTPAGPGCCWRAAGGERR